MRSKNRIYSFFIVLALLFWNPLSFYFIYGKTPVYESKLIQFLFGFVFVMGIVAIYFLRKNKIGKRLSDLLFSSSMAGILFSLIVLANGLIGLLDTVKKINKAENAGLIFEPGATIRWHTVEFDYLTKTNSLGLRDREINKDKGKNFRIACFGDSWTFGWGVNFENSWPAQLEQFLRSKGITDVEVINCGGVGSFTTTYKKNIEKVLPALKPDLVLLGVLQLDDLAQFYEYNIQMQKGVREKDPVTKKIAYNAKLFLKYSVNNILTLVRKGERKETTITDTWKDAANSFINKLTPPQFIRYSTLDDSIKYLLQSGNLNPGFLHYALNFSDRVVTFNNPHHPATQSTLSRMNKDIEEIKSICTAHGAELVFINLPTYTFTGHHVVCGPGDVFNPWLENNNKIDSMYRSVALKNALPYFELTDSFKALEDKSAYFFKYDAHPTVRGYQKIADLIGQYLVENNDKVKRIINK